MQLLFEWYQELLQLLQIYLFWEKIIKIRKIFLKWITKKLAIKAESEQFKVKTSRYLPGLFNPSLHKSEIYIKKMLRIVLRKPAFEIKSLPILQRHLLGFY